MHHDGLTRSVPALLSVGLVLMITAVAFEGLAAPTVLPATLEQLGGVALYGWAFSGFWLANLVGIPLAGAEADRRGPTWPFAAGAVAFSLGLLVAGMAPSMGWVVAGRVVQGLGAGAIGSITYVAIARGYPPHAQPRMIAVISSAWVLPGLVGPAVSGWIAEAFSWRWVFLGLAPLLPLAAIALAPALGRLPAKPTEAASERASGAVARDALVLAAGAGLALAALSSGQVLIGLALGGAGIGAAVASLRRLLPSGTLTARSPRGATIAVIALVSVAFFGVEAFVPLVVASIRSAGTVAGGLALTAAAITWAIGSWLQARLAPRSSRRRVTVAGLLLIGAGVLLETAIPLTVVSPVWLAALGWAVAGLGMGLAYSTLTLAVIEAAPRGGEGAASASVQLAEAIGIAVGTGLAGSIVSLAAGGPLGLAPGVVVADLIMFAVLLLALIATRAMPRRPLAPSGEGLLAAPADHGPSLQP